MSSSRGRSTLLDEADEPNDRLRSDVHQWRSRCYRRQRDWEAAREDIDRALELVEALDDTRRSAEVNLQASLVAERQGRWVLARRYAETSRDLFERGRRHRHQGRVLNNLAGLNHLLGDDDTAIPQLREAFAIFVDAQLEAEAGYVLSSLAEIHRERGDLDGGRGRSRSVPLPCSKGASITCRRSERRSSSSPARTSGRATSSRPRGSSPMVDESYALTESISHQARSWMVRGELELLRDNEIGGRAALPRGCDRAPADRPLETPATPSTASHFRHISRVRDPLSGDDTAEADRPTNQGAQHARGRSQAEPSPKGLAA